MIRRAVFLLAAVLFAPPLAGCLSAQQARTANAIMNGVACGVAAAQETPCTPQAVLEALARDAESQRTKVEAVAPQAAQVDSALTNKLLEQMAANTAANQALTKALLDLAMRTAPAAPAAEPAPSPAPTPSPSAPSSSEAPAPPPTPSPTPVSAGPGSA